MNYERIYKEIIENRKSKPLSENEYGERHHIIPKCLGGNDKKENLVKLTAREHFLCHYCLTKIYEGKQEYYKMLNAFMMMKPQSGSNKWKRYLNSRLYESLKNEYSKLKSKEQTGKGNSQFGTCWIKNFELKQSIKIKKEELQKYISEGWQKGRCIDFDFEKIKVIKQNLKKQKRNIEKEKRFIKNKLYFENLYNLYLEYGYKYLITSGIYTKSYQHLFISFKIYVENYKPLNKIH